MVLWGGGVLGVLHRGIRVDPVALDLTVAERRQNTPQRFAVVFTAWRQYSTFRNRHGAPLSMSDGVEEEIVDEVRDSNDPVKAMRRASISS